MVETIVLVTGGFDPIHSGHIAYFKSAKKLGDKLIVGLNSDKWLAQKKGSAFLPINERIEIVSNLSVVDETIQFEDDEHNSASNAITMVEKKYPNDPSFTNSYKSDMNNACFKAKMDSTYGDSYNKKMYK